MHLNNTGRYRQERPEKTEKTGKAVPLASRYIVLHIDDMIVQNNNDCRL